MTTTKRPDLLTIEGQLEYLTYQEPNEAERRKHEVVQAAMKEAWVKVSAVIPDGPGKTRVLHLFKQTGSTCHTVIAHHGA